MPIFATGLAIYLVVAVLVKSTEMRHSLRTARSTRLEQPSGPDEMSTERQVRDIRLADVPIMAYDTGVYSEVHKYHQEPDVKNDSEPDVINESEPEMMNESEPEVDRAIRYSHAISVNEGDYYFGQDEIELSVAL